MMIYIQIESVIQQDLELASLDPSQLEAAARAALRYASAQGELTLVLTDDEQLRLLNNQYRGIDSPTDVLSFPLDEIDPETGSLYLGDVIVSIPRAVAQAQAEGHSLIAETRLLVVHGTLHLLGYDHADDEERAAMWAAQSEILTSLAG